MKEIIDKFNLIDFVHFIIIIIIIIIIVTRSSGWVYKSCQNSGY